MLVQSTSIDRIKESVFVPDIVARAGPAGDSLSFNVTVMKSSAIRTPL